MGNIPDPVAGPTRAGELLQPAVADLLRSMFNDGDSCWPSGDKLPEETFLDEITSQGMAPLLWRRIAESKCCTNWPPAVLSALRNSSMQEVATEMLWDDDLAILLQALAGAGVKPILLKGTPLSHTLYPTLGIRPRCDTDLLIPESSRERVAALMKQLGYAGLYEASADYISTQMSYFRKGKMNVHHCYDIHWQLSNNNPEFARNFGYDGLFSGTVSILSLGDNARTLSNVDALIFACFHRAGHLSHSGDRLIWLYDIHLLTEALSEEEASCFCDKARELQVVTLCADAIATTQSWFGTSLSPVLESLLREEPGNESSSLYLQSSGRLDGIKNNALLVLKGLPTWRERMDFLLQKAFPPVEYMQWRYGNKQKLVLPWLYLKRFMEGAYIFLRR